MVDHVTTLRTSGRWAAVNAKIERLYESPGVGTEWYVQTFGALLSQVFSEYLSLERTYEANRDWDISSLAWHARNLLELCVWSLYCTKQRDNARRLYEDAGRDILDLSNAYKKNDETAGETDLLNALAHAEKELRERAASEGIEALDKSYMRVDNAAEECGMLSRYRISFKMASKFAHPTAMLILAPAGTLREETELRDYFFGEGCLSFIEAFVAIEAHLNQL
jgi:hypothetical protein